jgi:hypothetical protein
MPEARLWFGRVSRFRDRREWWVALLFLLASPLVMVSYQELETATDEVAENKDAAPNTAAAPDHPRASRSDGR